MCSSFFPSKTLFVRKGRRIWIYLLTIALISLPSFARPRPMYPSYRPTLRRRPSSYGYSNRQQYDQPRTPPPSSESLRSHYLDDENWMTNKRVRLWDVNLMSRKPNQYSWTSRLIVANVIAYVAQSFYPSITRWGVKLSHKILQGEDLYRLVSPVFLHGSVYHLFTNMYSLNNVGVSVERLFGTGRFLCSYLVAGAAGNYLSALQSPNPALGASGAVFGVMASLYVFLTRHDWLLGYNGRAYSDAITQALLINLALGAMNPMVDNWGHLGGAMGGAAMAYLFGPRLYLVELPDGGRTVVDKPVLRLPRYIESIPGTIQRVVRRMQIWRYTADLPDKPWRRKRRGTGNYHQRQDLPNRSIKPKDF